ncbi:MAG: hypothetical protein JXR63_10235 [Spirochaetales bacterium]|nr:hypothetical protein [Spirochaetales bacterium]
MLNPKSVILAIDIGTSFIKLALVSISGAVVRSENKSIEKYLLSNSLQKAWVLAISEAISDLKNGFFSQFGFFPLIDSVGICGNGPTIVAFSSSSALEGEVVKWDYPAIDKGFRGLYLSRLQILTALYSEKMSSYDHVLPCPEYLVYLMTGDSVAITPSSEFSQNMWSSEELAGIGFDSRLLPEFVLMDEYVGKVSSDGAKLFGLDKSASVFCVGADFFSTLIGSSTLFENSFCDRAGTSEGLNLCLGKSIDSQQFRVMPHVSRGFYNVSSIFIDSGSVCQSGMAVANDENLFLSILMVSDFERYLEFSSEYIISRSVISLDDFCKKYTEKNGSCDALIGYFSLYIVAFLRLQALSPKSINLFSIAGGQGVFNALNVAKASLFGSVVKVFYNPSAEVLGVASLAMSKIAGISLGESSTLFSKSCRFVAPSPLFSKFLDKSLKKVLFL